MTEVEAKFVSVIKSISSKRAAGAVFDGLPSNLGKTKKRSESRGEGWGGGRSRISIVICNMLIKAQLKINTSARVPLPVDGMTLMG